MPSNGQEESADAQSKSPERNIEKEKEKGGKSKAIAANTKGKDLSHVPCKFFRVGQCTAGASCVFSHHVTEPGETKEVCTWFVKGNCKFGHKCALAHILPGQPMSMDRKNKKTAQQQVQAANGGGKDREGRKEAGKSIPVKDRHAAGGLASRLAVSPGGIARPPMSISKATMSPSAPAPVLRDADFHFDSLEGVLTEAAEASQSRDIEEGSPSTATAYRKETIIGSASSGGAAPALSAAGSKEERNPTYAERVAGETRKPSPLPLSTPSAPRGFTSPNGAPTIDFGPVGSPPHHSPLSPGLAHPSPTRFQQTRTNGFEPGTSPTQQQTSETPFSAPLTHTMFNQYNVDRKPPPTSNDYAPKATGLATSLGTNMLMGPRAWDIQGLSKQVESEEDDIEDFLPSSLNELLTPAERKRRESRSNGVRPNIEAQHHRHSRSVPALTLMDNMMSIWSDDRLSPTAGGTGSMGRPFAPSSFGGDGLSGVMGGASNVSAGFLSSLHPPRPGISSRSVSDSRAMQQPPMSNQASKPSSFNNARFAYEPSTYGVPPHQNPDALLSGLSQMALSPSARALHSHAPGTSLPQGLAAGYSRMHARPNNSIYGALSPPNSAGLEEGLQQHRAPYVPGLTRVPGDRVSPPKQPQLTRRTPLGLSSPLAGPVISHEMDDDELFPIEIENHD